MTEGQSDPGTAGGLQSLMAPKNPPPLDALWFMKQEPAHKFAFPVTAANVLKAKPSPQTAPCLGSERFHFTASRG